MAHDLFRDTMVYVGEVPWHGLRRRIAATASASEFLRAGGLDWRVWTEPAPGAKPKRNGDFTRYTILREAVRDEAAPVALGLVTARYTPLQNTEAFAFFDPLIRDGWATYESAGALRDGEAVWVQARLRADMLLGGEDRIERFLLLRNRHDGEGAVSIRFTPVRVVCQNTLSFAEKHSPRFANLRHSRLLHARLGEVSTAALKVEVEAFSRRAAAMFEAMMQRRITTTERCALLDELCPAPSGKRPAFALPSRREIVEQRLIEQPVKDAQAGVDTVWGLYNAITWAEDERARIAGRTDPEAGLERMWFGSGAEFKAKVLERLSGVVAGP